MKPALEYATVPHGDSTSWTPPAIASVASPAHRLRHARWTETSDDEHAVSTARLGPRKSNRYEIRLAAMQLVFPEPKWASMLALFSTSSVL